MRRLLILLGLSCLAALGQAQVFGRFGYSDMPTVPGFLLSKDGFVARFGAADKFFYPKPPTSWKVVSVSDTQVDVDLGSGDGPTELNVSQFAPGFMLRFPKGFQLKVHSTSAPYLSWKEGSVGEDVPTPSVRWIGVSFREGEPPLVLGFLDSEVSLQIDGKLGDWTLHTLKTYTGWVRVALPFGTQPLATNSAGSLGRLSMAIAKSDEIWWQPAPKLMSFQVQDDDTALEATWQFDRKGVLIPIGAELAKLGQDPLTIKSNEHRLDGYTEEGPTAICDDDALIVRFPMRRIPLGRSLTVGSPDLPPGGTILPTDIPGVVGLALTNLVVSRDPRIGDAAAVVPGKLISGAQYHTEPNTGQFLPYADDGKGIDVAAADALLFQTDTLATKANSDGNTLLRSVMARRDWYTWRIWAKDSSVSRRAGALIAVAGALCPEPERRLDAAMVQAGLAAERGLQIFMRRAAHENEDVKLLEPLYSIRNTVFEMAHIPRDPSPFAESLLSPVRVFGEKSVRCQSAKDGYLLAWPDDGPVTLVSAFPLRLAGDGLEVSQYLGYSVITSKSGQARLALPPSAGALPAYVAPPEYAEPLK